MSQDKLSLVKKFRLSPREASMLADKAQQEVIDDLKDEKMQKRLWKEGSFEQGT